MELPAQKMLGAVSEKTGFVKGGIIRAAGPALVKRSPKFYSTITDKQRSCGLMLAIKERIRERN